MTCGVVIEEVKAFGLNVRAHMVIEEVKALGLNARKQMTRGCVYIYIYELS